MTTPCVILASFRQARVSLADPSALKYRAF